MVAPSSSRFQPPTDTEDTPELKVCHKQWTRAEFLPGSATFNTAVTDPDRLALFRTCANWDPYLWLPENAKFPQVKKKKEGANQTGSCLKVKGVLVTST